MWKWTTRPAISSVLSRTLAPSSMKPSAVLGLLIPASRASTIFLCPSRCSMNSWYARLSEPMPRRLKNLSLAPRVRPPTRLPLANLPRSSWVGWLDWVLRARERGADFSGDWRGLLDTPVFEVIRPSGGNVSFCGIGICPSLDHVAELWAREGRVFTRELQTFSVLLCLHLRSLHNAIRRNRATLV